MYYIYKCVLVKIFVKKKVERSEKYYDCICAGYDSLYGSEQILKILRSFYILLDDTEYNLFLSSVINNFGIFEILCSDFFELSLIFSESEIIFCLDSLIKKDFNADFQNLRLKENLKVLREYFKSFKKNLSSLSLDLGAGSGLFNHIFKIVCNCELISLDISYNLLKLNDNSLKIKSDAAALPFKDFTFSMVFSYTVLQDIDNIKLNFVMDEVYRILEKGGLAIISYLKTSKKSSLIESELRERFKVLVKVSDSKDNFFFVMK